MLDKQFDYIKSEIQELKAAYNMLLGATQGFCSATDKLLGEISQRLDKIDPPHEVSELNNGGNCE